MRSATPLKNNIFSGCSADGSALGSGPRGRGFKSRHSDHKELNVFALGSLVFEHTASCQSRTKVRDQATEPSAACGGCNEAEEEKNRENCDAERRARRPLFFSVSRGFKSRHSDHKELNVFALGSLVFEHTASCQSRAKVRDRAAAVIHCGKK